MANELTISYPTGNTLYGVILNSVGQIYNTATLAFEVPQNVNWANYDIAMPESGNTGIYRGTMPGVAAGAYSFVVRDQAGGGPATTDPSVGAENFIWDGSAIVDTTAFAVAVWTYATRTLTSFGTLVADTVTAILASALVANVWAYATRTLTSFGTLVANIWAYATRTLTQSAAQVAAVVAGSTVTVPPYTTWIINLTGLGSLADRAKLYATFKESPQIDTDANALIQVEETAGLLIANKAAAANPAQASILVTDAAAGNITITVDEAVTGFPVRVGMGYDVKKITTTGNAVLMTVGTFNISQIVTRAIA